MNNLLQKEINKLEYLKQLSEKYSDLELTNQNYLISRKSADQCNQFDICRQCNYIFLKLYFKENHNTILISEPIDITNIKNTGKLIDLLNSYKIKQSLILEIIKFIWN